MPKFDKSTGYKMKGSKFYGSGNQSPMKAVDSAVINSQKELGATENSWKQPGWAKIAKDVLAPPKKGEEKKDTDKEYEIEDATISGVDADNESEESKNSKSTLEDMNNLDKLDSDGFTITN